MTTPAAVTQIHQLIRPYNGEGDVVDWMEKLKIVADIQGLGDLHKMIPLFLEGAAFSLYKQMPAADKKNAGLIEKALVTAFSVNAYDAYELFIARRWREGETVDSFLSDIRRLASVVGFKGSTAIERAFVCGFPAAVSSQLRTNSLMNKVTLDQLVSQARILVAERANVPGRQLVATAACTAATATGGDRHEGFVERRTCFACGKPGHLARECNQKTQFTCQLCYRKGHTAKFCKQGNAAGMPFAPADVPHRQ